MVEASFRVPDSTTRGILRDAHFHTIALQTRRRSHFMTKRLQKRTRSICDQQTDRQNARHSQIPDPSDGRSAIHLFLHIPPRSISSMARSEQGWVR
jgi:hypothetical protein